MTKTNVIKIRNVLKHGKTAATSADAPKLNRPIKIFGENGVQVLDELTSFVMWDDNGEIVYGIARGNGINGGQIPQTAQAYGNVGWSTGIKGENFQIIAIPYEEIAAICCAATMDHVQEMLNYYESTLSGAAKAAFHKAADNFMTYNVKPLHDIETYVASNVEDCEYPYKGRPKWDADSESFKNPDGTDPKTNRLGQPYPDPADYFNNDETTMR